jgi:tight adherence protein C
MIFAIVAAVMVGVLVVLVSMLFSGNNDNVDARLRDLRAGGRGTGKETQDRLAVQNVARDRLRELGQMVNMRESDRSELEARLMQAGIYNKNAVPLFMGIKLFSLLTLPLVGLALIATGMIQPMFGLGISAVGGIIGFAGPSFFLDNRKKKRQMAMRRALPDAMDVIIICMEGGLSLPAAIQRVGDELGVAHPLLAQELKICEREIQLGKRTGEALKELALRSDMEELRSLAGVVTQAEKYGASLASALRIHAQTMRQRRALKAEEMAHKAATKMLFPTLLFIFPGIFLVILGPAVIKILQVFEDM